MKQKISYICVFIGLVIAGIWSCERDDICADITQTTPQLIIRFYDANEPDELKAARRLTVSALDENNIALDSFVYNFDTDSLVIPLRIEGEGVPTISRFILEKDTDFRLDSLPNTMSNIDTITVTYRSQFIYVSRACGYKSIYNNVIVTREVDDDIWILERDIINTTIDNETEAHVIFRH